MKDERIYLRAGGKKTTFITLLKRDFSFSTFKSSLIFLHRVGQKTVNYIAKSQELKVWQKVNRQGNTYWEAYDPVSGKSFCSGSEADIRAWIEQLYR